MKKYFWTLSVMALFAVGFAASDDEKSSSSSSSQTEQKQEIEAEQETEAERQEREQKEKREQQEDRKKEVAEEGYKMGYEKGFTTSVSLYPVTNFENAAQIRYSYKYGAPMTSEEKELYNIFKENYLKGVKEGYNAPR